ncbi:CPBP family intramembrane glutamic endopeptidase [Agrococcus sp. SGAir0287]|uniref:CPBP family intramembrane glutamic endopeptidase n=1 Tax=Agrococcus sp. SGAir0287 TaxID=2070347 RepID=UPI0010CCFB34|nr:CPBP family intramembrane glutamic endopeptidase [Agrococcus sp. SGAir0287]QCR20663.1 CPBP family intramembrane metalloprotease domain-containing protein [Agrococcus sp. SGAir0287]
MTQERLARPWFPDAEPLVGSRRSRWVEIACVLLVSLGASAIWSIIQIADLATRPEPIGDQVVALNPTRSDRPWLDLAYQLTGHLLDLVPVVLVCWLLWRARRPHLARLGITFDRPARDAGWGAVLLLVIGIPGLAIFVAGRALGLTAALAPSPLDAQWFTIPVLLVAAFRAGVTEEVIVVGYLFERLRSLGWGRYRIIIAAALLRATYHLYQGVGGFISNLLLGLLFGWLYSRYGRLLPLVIAHILIDVVAFVGYPLAAGAWPALFGLDG